MAARLRPGPRAWHATGKHFHHKAGGNYIGHQTEYRAVLRKIETLMMADQGSAKGEKLDVLVTLVEAYERKHYSLDQPDPVAAIKFEMEQ